MVRRIVPALFQVKSTIVSFRASAHLRRKCREACGGAKEPGDLFRGYKGVGDPCRSPGSCLTGRCSLAHACIRGCETDADCASYPDVPGQGVVHVCVATKKGEKVCLPRCDAQADCTAITVKMPTGLASKTETLRCAEVGGSHKACIMTRDTAVPACYPNDSDLGGTGCSSADDCLCGTDCISTGGSLRACQYACTDNASCTSASDGLLNLCFHGSSTSHCGS